MEVDWASLHKILSDTTRRSILEVLAEKESLTYTDIMTLLQVTNTGRLNYHLKVLGNLLSKDEEGRYHLTEQGRQAANLLRTFPERVPAERRLSALKVAASVVLILLGVLFIVTFATLLLFTTGPVATTTTSHAALSAEAIPQNTTIYLTGWSLSAPTLNMAWDAASPVRIFILNQTQYNGLLLGHSSTAQPQVLQNFTGAPESWARDFNARSGNLSISLPQGQYYFYAWSGTSNLLDSFGLAQTQTQAQGGTSISPFLILYSTILVAIGVFLIVLAVSILTRRVWR